MKMLSSVLITTVHVCLFLLLVTGSDSSKSPMTLFLIGKTGHGKSATGNSLLGREAFQVSDSVESVTNVVQMATTTEEDRVIHVIDGPGLGDTRMDTVTAIRKISDDMKQGIAQSPQGIDAFLIVLKYGNRFTDEEKTTIDSLKSILGDNVLKYHSIIVFTHGEVFDMKNRESGSTFTKWCQAQTGALGDIITECQHRCVLVHNSDMDKMRLHIDEIISHADNLVATRSPYTIKEYDAVETGREQLIVRMDGPRLQGVMDTDVECKHDQLKHITVSGDAHDTKLTKLASLKDDVTDLRQRIKTTDKGTGVLSSQSQACDSLYANVETQEGVVRQAKANEEEERRLQAVRDEQIRIQEEADRVRKRRKKKKFLGLF